MDIYEICFQMFVILKLIKLFIPLGSCLLCILTIKQNLIYYCSRFDKQLHLNVISNPPNSMYLYKQDFVIIKMRWLFSELNFLAHKTYKIIKIIMFIL